MNLSIHSPDELIAAIPHLIGFQPDESIVFVPMGSDLPVARVDLPMTARDRDEVWDSIGSAFRRYAQPDSNVAIVCLSTDRVQANAVGQDFSARLADMGIGTPLLLWADQTRWADLNTGDMGLLTTMARENIAAATVLAGRTQPVASRESLAASLVGDREPVATLLPETRTAARSSTAKAETHWALARMQRFQHDGVRLTDTDAARLLVAVDSTPTRDRLWLDMNRSNVASHISLWTDMTRRAPDEVRTAPASLLGFAGWLSGDGALAWCALDQVPEGKHYPLANLVATAVQSGMHPREWEAANVMSKNSALGASAPLRRPPASLGSIRPAPGI